MEKHDVAHLEKQINELSDSLKRLAADTFLGVDQDHP